MKKLKLTNKEAKVLYTVLSAVGGHSDGPRGAANAILSKLHEMGVSGIYGWHTIPQSYWPSGKPRNGVSLYFPDTWPEKEPQIPL